MVLPRTRAVGDTSECLRRHVVDLTASPDVVREIAEPGDPTVGMHDAPVTVDHDPCGDRLRVERLVVAGLARMRVPSVAEIGHEGIEICVAGYGIGRHDRQCRAASFAV